MSLAELVIMSVMVEGRSKSEVARDYKISRYWVQQLVTATRPRARPRSSPGRAGRTPTRARSAWTWRTRSSGCARSCPRQGLDAGADTIRTHLQRPPGVDPVPSVSTIWRVLTRRGFVTPQPQQAAQEPRHPVRGRPAQ